MGFDRGRRGSRGGGDKRDRFGDEGGFDSGPRFGGGGYGGGGNYGGGYNAGAGAGGGGGGGFGGRPRSGGFGGGAGGGGSFQGTVIGTAKGRVKFFNQQKGFGFVVREDGGEDVFVHISAVEAAGLTGLADGQPMEFTLSERNGRVSAIELKIEGDPLPIESRPPRVGDRDRGDQPRQTTGERVEGTVKFFNAMKGFGFIQRDDGQPDAFVHISAVERAGLHGLDEGQRLSFELEIDRRGKMAATSLQAL